MNAETTSNYFTFRLTARAVVLLALIIFLALTVVRSQYDILATILVVGLVATLITISIWGFISARTLFKRVSASTWFNSARTVSGEPLSFTLELSPFSLNPFFSLIVTPRLDRGIAQLGSFLFEGLQQHSNIAKREIFLPHRGIWQLHHCNFELRDAFGMTVSRWKQATSAKVEVLPPQSVVPEWPLVVSSTRSGESIEHIQQRQGDLLDLKPYHPSDGARRIVWKLFAKTNELVARQPERSVDPEGRCFVYAIVQTEDDNGAHAANAYVDGLIEAGCDVLFTCLGSHGKVYSNHALAPLVEHAFDATDSALAVKEFQSWFVQIQQDNVGNPIETLIIVVGSASLMNDKDIAQITEIGSVAGQHAARPHFLLCHAPHPHDLANNRVVTEFFRLCSDNGWEVSY